MSLVPHFEPNLILGPLFVGNAISIFLVGVSTVQTYIYSKRYPEDKRLIKYFVGVLWFFDIVHAGTTAAGTYEICVLNFGHPERFVVIPKTLCATLLVSGIIYPLVQGFFAYRIWALTESRILYGLCCALIVTRSGATIATGGLALAMTSLTTFISRYRWLGSFALATSTVGDLLVAVSLSVILMRRKTQLVSKTAQIVDKLILWTLQTGVLTSMAAVTLLVCFLAMPNNWIWASLIILVPRLYTNSLLASLNARESLNKLNYTPSLHFSIHFNQEQSTRREPLSVALAAGRPSDVTTEQGTTSPKPV